MEDLLFDLEMDVACLMDDIKAIQDKLSILSAMVEARDKDKSTDED